MVTLTVPPTDSRYRFSYYVLRTLQLAQIGLYTRCGGSSSNSAQFRLMLEEIHLLPVDHSDILFRVSLHGFNHQVVRSKGLQQWLDRLELKVDYAFRILPNIQ